MSKFFREKTFCFLFHLCASAMFAVLFHHCLGITGENSEILSDENIYFKTDSILFNALLLCFSFLFLYFIGKFSEKCLAGKKRNIILGIVCTLSALISFYWVFASKSVPQADQLYLCRYADAFNQGDYTALQKGGYIARYPQQLGMVTLLRVLFMLFGDGNYLAFQCLTAALVPLLVLSGCQIVRLLSDNNVRAELYYLLFILCCFPMYAYTTFVYGDLISVIFGLFGVWMYLSCLKQFSWTRLVLFGVSMGIAVELRKNLLILVIALAIVALGKLLFDRSLHNLALAAALALGCGIMHLGIWGMYCPVKGENAPAVPALLFIVMGLNDDYGYAGWENGYDLRTFALMDDHVGQATEKGMQDLKMYLNIYKNDPDYMVDFFTRKMNSQWNSPMYQAVVMNDKVQGNQLPIVKSIYEQGIWAKIIAFGMKIYQLLMYGSILFLLLTRRKDFARLEKYLLLIAVFGGFLFSFLWEAKTRYILPYLFMQIPYMSIGADRIISWLETQISRRNPERRTKQLP